MQVLEPRFVRDQDGDKIVPNSAALLILEPLFDAARADALKWAIQLCGSGMTVGMIRKLLHNKIVEITGEGEKA